MQLKGRSLSEEEHLLLLGPRISKLNNFKLFKASDPLNFIPFIQSFLSSEESEYTLEGFDTLIESNKESWVEKVKYICVFHDIPLGASYWHARTNQLGYTGKDYPTFISDKDLLSVEYNKHLNLGNADISVILSETFTFFKSLYASAYNLLELDENNIFKSCINEQEKFNRLLMNLSWTRGNVLSAIDQFYNLSVICLYENKVKSIISLNNFLNYTEKLGLLTKNSQFGLHLFRDSSLNDFVKEEQIKHSLTDQEITEVIQYLYDNVISNLTQYSRLINSLGGNSPYYSFSTNKVQLNSLVIDKDNKLFISLGNSSAKNILEYGNVRLAANLESWFSFNDETKYRSEFPLFTINQTAANRYFSAPASYFFFDKVGLNEAGYYSLQSYVEFPLEPDFFSAINSTFKEITSNASSLKRELKEFKTLYVDPKEIPDSGRYEIIKSGYLFSVLKNSKAKEIIKKIQITRGISSNLSELTLWLLHLLLKDELTLPKECLNSSIIDTISLGIINNNIHNLPKITNEFSLLQENFNTEINKLKQSNVCNTKIKDTVKSIYTATDKFNGSNSVLDIYSAFGENAKKNWAQDSTTLLYPFFLIFNGLLKYSGFNEDTFSSTTGKLKLLFFRMNLYNSNISKPALGIYGSLRTFTDVREVSYNSTSYLLENNFLIVDPQTEEVLTTAKRPENLHRLVYNYNISRVYVNYKEGFNFSPQVLTALNDLKLCKTFADYKKWFLSIEELLKTKINNFNQELSKTLTLSYLSLAKNYLEVAAAEEAQFLPKPIQKVMGRKKKITAVQAASSDTDTTEEINTLTDTDIISKDGESLNEPSK